MRIDSTSSGSTHSLSDSHVPSTLAQPITPSSSNSEGHQHYFHQNNGESAAAENQHRRAASSSIPELYNPRPEYQQMPDYLQVPQNMGTLANFHYLDDTNFGGNFQQFDYAIPTMPAAIYSSSQVGQGNDTDNHNQLLDRARIRPISRIGFVMPGTPQFRPAKAFGKVGVSSFPGCLEDSET